MTSKVSRECSDPGVAGAEPRDAHDPVSAVAPPAPGKSRKIHREMLLRTTDRGRQTRRRGCREGARPGFGSGVGGWGTEGGGGGAGMGVLEMRGAAHRLLIVDTRLHPVTLKSSRSQAK